MKTTSTTKGETMITFTYNQIAESYKLWTEYVDNNPELTEEQFDEMSIEEKVSVMVDCFGPETELDI